MTTKDHSNEHPSGKPYVGRRKGARTMMTYDMEGAEIEVLHSSPGDNPYPIVSYRFQFGGELFTGSFFYGGSSSLTRAGIVFDEKSATCYALEQGIREVLLQRWLTHNTKVKEALIRGSVEGL